MRRAMARAAAEEATAAEVALEAGAGAEPQAEATTSASGAARGESSNNTKNKKQRMPDHDKNVSNHNESISRQRRVRSRIDLSLFTYPGFFWVDRIPQAGVFVEAPGTSTRSTSSGDNNEDNTSTCSSGKNAGEECGVDSSMDKSTTRMIASSVGGDGECASAETSCKKSKSNASPIVGYKSPMKRITPKRAAAKHENGNGSAARDAMKPEAERTSSGQSSRTRSSDKSQHTSPPPPIVPTIKYGR